MNEINRDDVKIPSRVRLKLLEFQVEQVINIVISLMINARAFDASDTGTGKTYVTVAVCLVLNLYPLIICPKSVINTWRKVMRYFRCEYYGIINYESLQNCKYYKEGEDKKSRCKYIKRQRETEDGEYIYQWRKLPSDMIVVYDEVHRCKNKRTQNHMILESLADTTMKILILSATGCDKPENFGMIGYVLGLYPSVMDCKKYLKSLGGDNVMNELNKIIFPRYGSRMRIRDLGDLFPKNTIICNCYDMSTAKEIEEQYRIIEDEVDRLKNKEDNSGCALTRILYARMRIEQLKIPTLIEQARMRKENGKSVIIFVNFTGTLETDT